jgi:hypothetical protein
MRCVFSFGRSSARLPRREIGKERFKCAVERELVSDHGQSSLYVRCRRHRHIHAVSLYCVKVVTPASSLQLKKSLPLSLLLALSALSFCVLGYHPDSEDGGIYAAAVQQRVHPWLFPHDHAFVAAHVGNGVFAWLVSGLVRLGHLPVPTVLVLLQFAAILVTLLASSRVAAACFQSASARFGSVLVMALSLSLPIAGTALYLSDPYCTARSISTPLLLFALDQLLRRRLIGSVFFLAAAFGLHPLMALWGMLLLGSVWSLQQRRRILAFTLFCGIALFFCSAIYLLSPVDGEVLRLPALTRSYWFLVHWEWYEILGALAPPILMALTLYRHQQTRRAGAEQRILVQAHAAATALCLLIALLFARSSGAHLLIARMQPLRALHLLYAVFVLMAGGWIGNFLHEKIRSKKTQVAIWCVLSVCIATPLLLAQLTIYPASRHLEFSWRPPANGWTLAFRWCGEHTSEDALFALDAHYITVKGEDAQNFRAISLRSSLPDYSKDGGVASVSPSLAADWLTGVTAQTNLNGISDAERIARLAPLHVDWIVLPSAASTSFLCDYQNDVAKVCRLPR